MSAIVATADPTTGTVLLSFNQIEARDQFTRVVAGGWGVATSGETWTTSGSIAGDYSVNGTQGLYSMTSLAVSRNTILGSAVTGNDMDSTISITIPVVPTGGNFTITHGVRGVTPTNQYMITAVFQPGGVVTAQLQKIVLGVTSNVSTAVTSAAPHTSGNAWTLRIAVCGSQLKGKVWRNSFGEPDWMVTGNDFDLVTGQNVLCRASFGSSVTNVLPITLTWDNLRTGISQPVRLWRVTPDGVRTELRGSPMNTDEVTTTSTSGAAIAWDNEAPFDVDVFYELTSNCSTVVYATSNTINLDSDGDGWLRDPVDPTRNIRIVMNEFFDECVDQDVVVYSGMDPKTYANSAGIYDVVDDRRPITISQTRKNYGSVLRLTSFSLDDIDTLEDIFDPNRILLLSLPMSYGWAHRSFGTDYVTFYDVDQNFLGVDQEVTARAWTAPFRLSYAPPDLPGGTGGNGIGGGGATYDDLAASVIGTTYNSLTAAGFTFFQIAAGTGY